MTYKPPLGGVVSGGVILGVGVLVTFTTSPKDFSSPSSVASFLLNVILNTSSLILNPGGAYSSLQYRVIESLSLLILISTVFVSPDSPDSSFSPIGLVHPASV